MYKLLALALALLPSAARADSRLLYLEGQAVAGYSSASRGVIYHSAAKDDMMQKTSVGVDYIQKFASDGGDWGSLYVESRLAWDQETRPQFQPQLYNGYLRVRAPAGYFWVGHNRVAAGLESYFDTHAALLQTLQMYGAGFDRDWGIGMSKDGENGDTAVSFTTGSGMPLSMYRNYLLSARICDGVLSRDNYNTSLYYSGGKIPDIIGYRVLDPKPITYNVLGTDFTYLWNRFELRGDLRMGQRGGESLYAMLGRLGVNLMDENRLKLELQAVGTKSFGLRDNFLATALSYAVNADLSVRTMFEYEHLGADKRLLMQLYYYIGI